MYYLLTVLKVLLPALLLTLPAMATAGAPGAPRYTSDATCATEDAFRKELERLLADHSEQLEFNAKVQVTGVEHQWRVKLVIKDRGETFVRMVRVDECAQAPRVGALLIAITVDPGLLEKFDAPEVLSGMQEYHPPSTENESDKPTPAAQKNEVDASKRESSSEKASRNKAASKKQNRPRGVTQPADQSSAETTDNRKVPLSLTLAAHINMNFATLPQAAFGPGLVLGLAVGKWWITLGVDGSFSGDQSIGGTGDGTFDADLLCLSAGLGYTFGSKTLQIHPNVGVATFTIFADTQNLPTTVENTATSFATWLGADLYWFASPRFGLFGAASAHLLSNPPRYEIGGMGEVHRVRRMAGFIKIGPFFRF